jgi:hypothetical protein
MCSVVPQSRPSLLWAARDRKRPTEVIDSAPSAGVTGENSPLLTNQPEKRKIDRAIRNIFSGVPLSTGKNPTRSKETEFISRTIPAARGCGPLVSEHAGGASG